MSWAGRRCPSLLRHKAPSLGRRERRSATIWRDVDPKKDRDLRPAWNSKGRWSTAEEHLDAARNLRIVTTDGDRQDQVPRRGLLGRIAEGSTAVIITRVRVGRPTALRYAGQRLQRQASASGREPALRATSGLVSRRHRQPASELFLDRALAKTTEGSAVDHRDMSSETRLPTVVGNKVADGSSGVTARPFYAKDTSPCCSPARAAAWPER